MRNWDSQTDPRVVKYCEGVLSGKIVAGKTIIQGVERFIRDLADGWERGLRFDYEQAQTALDFCGLCHHSKGEHAGQPFVPEPWQAYVLWNVFGWHRADGRRRFNEAMVEVAKKNGKSFMAAVVALIGLVLDCEPGAEVYTTATMRKQARLVWDEAARIVKRSPHLKKMISIHGSKLEHLPAVMMVEATNSKLEPLSSDGDATDGPSVHMAILDELHRHKTRDMYDSMKQGTANRRNPLLFIITTAGDDDPETIYAEQHDYAIKVLSRVVEDDSFFAFVATLDKGDDWQDERTWPKANPNLGVSVQLDGLRDVVKQAAAKPNEQATVKRFRFNLRGSIETPWLDPALWEACRSEIDWRRFEGVPCYGGLDLSSTTDLTALALLFPDGDRVALRVWAWCPEDSIEKRGHDDRAPYKRWAQEGWLIPTPGDVVDYRFIQERLEEIQELHPPTEIGYDRAKAADVVVRLADSGLPMVQSPQGPVNMTMPIRRFEDLVATRRLQHDGNPLLTWCLHNVRIAKSTGDLIKIVKRDYRARIDPVTAALIAKQRMLIGETGQRRESVYATRGIRTLET